jgi:transcriptional regulator with XRE-family HTH domain
MYGKKGGKRAPEGFMTPERFRKLRNQFGITTTEIAELAGVTNGYVSLYETRKKFPSVYTKRQLNKALIIAIAKRRPGFVSELLRKLLGG